MKYLSIILSGLFLFGCRGKLPKTNYVYYNNPDDAKRIVAKNVKLPSEILELNFIEYNITLNNTRVPGPCDYKSYLRIKVPIDDVEKWISSLSPPYSNSTTYAVPLTKQEWWIPESDFKSKTLYETAKYFNCFNGWLCVDKINGYIYAYTFTR